MKGNRAALTAAMAATAALAIFAERSGAAQHGLTQARAALGNARAVASVKTLRLKGQRRTRFQVMRRGARTVEYQIEAEEILILFPDHYLTISDNRAIPGLGATREGFAGDAVIGRGLVGTWRNPETFGYLALALLLKTDTAFPFTPKDDGPAFVRFEDRNGVLVTADLDAKTSRPIRLRFDMPARGNDGRPRGGLVPTRIELSDFRPVAGLTLPHALARFQRDELVTEQTFASIEVNPPLARTDFQQ